MQTENQNDPKSIQALMNESTLGTIVKKAQILDKIDRSLSDLLDPKIRSATRVLNLKENSLILASSNSAIATRIRYQEEDLLKKLNKIDDLPKILHIECVVRP